MFPPEATQITTSPRSGANSAAASATARPRLHHDPQMLERQRHRLQRLVICHHEPRPAQPLGSTGNVSGPRLRRDDRVAD